jgi:hypothetical protein
MFGSLVVAWIGRRGVFDIHNERAVGVLADGQSNPLS